MVLAGEVHPVMMLGYHGEGVFVWQYESPAKRAYGLRNDVGERGNNKEMPQWRHGPHGLAEQVPRDCGGLAEANGGLARDDAVGV